MFTLQDRCFTKSDPKSLISSSERLMSNLGNLFNMPSSIENVDRKPPLTENEVNNFTKFLEKFYYPSINEDPSNEYSIEDYPCLSNSVNGENFKIRLRYDSDNIWGSNEDKFWLKANAKQDSDDSYSSSVENTDVDDIDMDDEIGACLEIQDDSTVPTICTDFWKTGEILENEQNDQYQLNDKSVLSSEHEITKGNKFEIQKTNPEPESKHIDEGECLGDLDEKSDDVSSKHSDGSDSESERNYVPRWHSSRKTTNKRGKQARPRTKPNKCTHMWEFLRELLEDKEFCPRVITWTSKQDKEFRLVDTRTLARLWGAKKNKMQMTYEKMSRALRYYYQLHILEKVPNKRLHFRFGKAAVWKL